MRRVADRMRAAERQLDRDLTSGIRRAVRPLGGEIKKAVPAYLPSGYAPIMAAAVTSTPSVRRTRNAGVSVRVFARGREKLRYVRAINAGALRHPVFGHFKVWRVTSVKAGFVTEPFQRMRGPILDEMERVVTAHVERIAHG